MSTAPMRFAGAIPELYDALFVPMIFEPYAADLAVRIADRAPSRVLEIAAGTGAVTRALAEILGPDATIVATDLSQDMLDRAAMRQGADHRVTFSQADAQALPFGDASFDAAVCQFGVMFFPDKVDAHREARRVLVPGSRYVLSVWDAIDRNPFTAEAVAALAEIFPKDPPKFMNRLPHGYADRQRVGADVAAAGFGSVAVETVAKTSRARSARDVAFAHCQGTLLRVEIEARRPGGLDAVTDEVTARLESRFGSGPLEAPLSAHIVEAVA